MGSSLTNKAYPIKFYWLEEIFPPEDRILPKKIHLKPETCIQMEWSAHLRPISYDYVWLTTSTNGRRDMSPGERVEGRVITSLRSSHLRKKKHFDTLGDILQPDARRSSTVKYGTNTTPPATKDHIFDCSEQLRLTKIGASGAMSQMAKSSTGKNCCQSELQGTVENNSLVAGIWHSLLLDACSPEDVWISSAS